MDDWREMKTAPHDVVIRLRCRGHAHAIDPAPFECDGQWIGSGWRSVDTRRALGAGGMVDPIGWREKT